MAPTVDQIVTEIIRREGGYVNDPNDRGGPTNMGVTQATLSEWLGRPASIAEVQDLDEATVKEIFLKKFFYGPRIDALPDDLEPIIFDASILYGYKRAIIFVQTVINLAGFGPISVDGVLGPETLSKAELAYSKMGPYMINAIVEERINFNHRIIANDPSQAKYKLGWDNRAKLFEVAIKE